MKKILLFLCLAAITLEGTFLTAASGQTPTEDAAAGAGGPKSRRPRGAPIKEQLQAISTAQRAARNAEIERRKKDAEAFKDAHPGISTFPLLSGLIDHFVEDVNKPYMLDWKELCLFISAGVSNPLFSTLFWDPLLISGRPGGLFDPCEREAIAEKIKRIETSKHSCLPHGVNELLKDRFYQNCLKESNPAVSMKDHLCSEKFRELLSTYGDVFKCPQFKELIRKLTAEKITGLSTLLKEEEFLKICNPLVSTFLTEYPKLIETFSCALEKKAASPELILPLLRELSEKNIMRGKEKEIEKRNVYRAVYLPSWDTILTELTSHETPLWSSTNKKPLTFRRLEKWYIAKKLNEIDFKAHSDAIPPEPMPIKETLKEKRLRRLFFPTQQEEWLSETSCLPERRDTPLEDDVKELPRTSPLKTDGRTLSKLNPGFRPYKKQHPKIKTYSPIEKPSSDVAAFIAMRDYGRHLTNEGEEPQSYYEITRETLDDLLAKSDYYTLGHPDYNESDTPYIWLEDAPKPLNGLK